MTAPPIEPSLQAPGRVFSRLRDQSPAAAGLIAVIFLTEAVIGVLLLAINPQYPASRLGEGVRITGLAFSVYGAAKMPGQPIGGWLADRFEPRIVLIGGLLLSLPTIIIMERFQNVWAYILAWIMFGLTLAVVWPTVYAIVGHRFRPDRQGRLLALVSMGQIAGTAAGTGAGAFVVDHVSYGGAFGLALLIEAIALSIAILAVPRTRVDGPTSLVPGTALPPSGFSSIRRLVTLNVAMLIGLIMLLSTAVAMIAPDLKPYSDQILHVSYSTFVLMLAIPATVAALLIVPSGYIADRFGRNLPIGLGLFLFAASLLLLTLTHSPLLSTLFATIAAVGYVLVLPAFSASLLDLSSSGNRGLLTGLSTSIQAIGLVVGPAVGGFLIDASGPLAPFRVAFAIVFVTGLLSIVYAGRTRAVYRERVQSAKGM